MSNKKSIRFFNDRKVRAVWSEEENKWYFSATDVVRAINNEEDYTKSRNYWKYLKGKLTKEGFQLVSATNQFKFEAPDGKMPYGRLRTMPCMPIPYKQNLRHNSM